MSADSDTSVAARKTTTATRKRRASHDNDDDGDLEFDVEKERAKLRAKRTRTARSSIRRKMTLANSLLKESRSDLISLSTQFAREFESADDYEESFASFGPSYRQCHDKLLQLELQISAIRQALPDAFMQQQQTQAALTFGLEDIALSGGRFGLPSIILADPPWDSENPGSALGTKHQYPTMSDEALCALPVAGAASEDCALLLWTTFPKLESAFRVLRAWGFRYQTVFMVWIKIEKYLSRLRMTHGAVTRPNAEIILIGTRGNMRTPLRKNFRHCNVLLSRPQEHSRKPEIIKQIATELYGDKPRMEMFSRSRTLDWRCYGNETGEFNSDGTLQVAPEQIRETRVADVVPETKYHAAEKKQRRNNLGAGAFANAKQKRLCAPLKRGKGGFLKASVQTLGYYTPHNCITKQHSIFYSDGAGTEQREEMRNAYLEYVESLGDGGEYQPLSSLRPVDCVTTNQLANNRHIDEYYSDEDVAQQTNLSRHPLYASLTNQEVAENIELIYAEQKRNSDKLFAFNYNKKVKPIRYAQ